MIKKHPVYAKVRTEPCRRNRQLSPETLEKAIFGYLQDARMQMFSGRTIEEKVGHTGKLVWFVKRQNVEIVDECCVRDFLTYISTAHLTPEGRGGHAADDRGFCGKSAKKAVLRNTVRSYFTSLRIFFNWCLERRLIDESPLAHLKPPSYQDRPVTPMSIPQIDQLIAAAQSGRQPLRDAAIVWLLFDAGLRAFELAALEIGDVDQYNNSLFVQHGKGDKSRTVYMGKRCGEAMWAYLGTRESADLDEPLFESRKGGHLTANGLGELFDRLEKRAGISGVRCSPHTLRHSYAVESLANGMGELALGRSMGHTTNASTRKYANFVDAQMQRMRNQYSPGNQIRANAHKKGRPRMAEGDGGLIEAFGERKRLVSWLKDARCVVGKCCLLARLKSGVDPETAMTEPSQRGKKLPKPD